MKWWLVVASWQLSGCWNVCDDPPETTLWADVDVVVPNNSVIETAEVSVLGQRTGEGQLNGDECGYPQQRLRGHVTIQPEGGAAVVLPLNPDAQFDYRGAVPYAPSYRLAFRDVWDELYQGDIEVPMPFALVVTAEANQVVVALTRPPAPGESLSVELTGCQTHAGSDPWLYHRGNYVWAFPTTTLSTGGSRFKVGLVRTSASMPFPARARFVTYADVGVPAGATCPL